MDNRLLNVGELMQTLLDRDKPDGSEVQADLDVDSFEAIPFITHSAIVAQRSNGIGIWAVTLTVNIFLEPRGAHQTVSALYAAIHAWGEDPDNATVPGVGAIEEVEDLNAFTPASGAALMNNKVVRHYQGSFNLIARIH